MHTHILRSRTQQAKSRQKMLDKMEEAGLIQPVYQEKKLMLRFPEAGQVCGHAHARTQINMYVHGIEMT